MARTSHNSRTTTRKKSTSSGSFAGVMDMARERPVAAVAAAAGAAAAGVFLWSKRAQISDQLSQLSDQIGEWTDTMVSDRSSAGRETLTGAELKSDGRTKSSPTRRSRPPMANRRPGTGNGSSLNATNSAGPIA